MADRKINVSLVREFLDYSPDTGVFRWKSRALAWFKSERDQKIWNTRYAGRVAGSHIHHGYEVICIFGRRYLAHRLAWLHVHGEWPEGEIDHTDRNTSNNAIANLRSCSRFQNSHNALRNPGTTSQFAGVSWDKQRRKWAVKLRVGGRRRMLGRFDSEDEAAIVYIKAKQNVEPLWSPAAYPAGWQLVE